MLVSRLWGVHSFWVISRLELRMSALYIVYRNAFGTLHSVNGEVLTGSYFDEEEAERVKAEAKSARLAEEKDAPPPVRQGPRKELGCSGAVVKWIPADDGDDPEQIERDRR